MEQQNKENIQNIVDNVVPAVQQPKQNNILVIILSVLLLISVSVSGYFAYQTQHLANELSVRNNESRNTANTILEPTIKPIATESSVVDSTANWQTYTNTKYGFIFKHPSDLKVDQVSSSPYDQYKLVYMGEKQKASGRTQTSIFDGYIFYVSLRGSDPIDKVAQDAFNGSKQSCFDHTKWSTIADSTIDGKESKTYEVLNCMTDYTENFVSSGGNTFAITQIYVGEDPEYSKYKEITKQILSTFKFTN